MKFLRNIKGNEVVQTLIIIAIMIPLAIYTATTLKNHFVNNAVNTDSSIIEMANVDNFVSDLSDD